MRSAAATWLVLVLAIGVIVRAGPPAGGPGQAASPAAGEGSASLAEPPHWPVGLKLPQSLTAGWKPARGKQARKADVLVWTPPKAKRIRAALLIPNNSDSKIFGEHAALRKVAAKHEMGIVYLRRFAGSVIERSDPPRQADQLPAVLAHVAKRTGIAEFRHCPWITFGKSSRGRFPFRTAWWFPKRVIASISYHAETPTWPIADWARLEDETILHVNVNGELEWGGTWAVHVRPSLLNYRARTKWLPHMAVARDVGHGDYADVHGGRGWDKPFPHKVTCIDVWDYLAVFVDKALALRVPTDKYPTDGPIALKQVDEGSGYLIEPFAIEDIFGRPRLPLVDSKAGYLVGDKAEKSTNGFAAIPPAKGFRVPDGVPVVKPEMGRSPSKWLVTEDVGFAMKRDPMRDLGGLEKLRPNPGDKVEIDGREVAFRPIEDRHVGRRGGVVLNRGLQKSREATLLGYTVVEVPQAGALKLRAPFTLAGRLQVVLNGVPVDHKQVVQLQRGLYPMLFVLRLKIKWASVKPWFEEVSEEEIKQAKAYAVEKARRQAEFRKRLAAGPRDPLSFIHKPADVEAARRKKMFWVADMEQARAWIKLHTAKLPGR